MKVSGVLKSLPWTGMKLEFLTRSRTGPGSGDVTVKLSAGFPELQVSRKTADLLTSLVAKFGATVVARRLYDLTNGWDGHPGGEVPMVMVTHHPSQDWPRDGVPIFFEHG